MNTDSHIRRYLKISLLNIAIVALLGSILRYKILYSLPFLDQKHVQHSHSHFAFAGWVTQTLMVLMVAYLSKQKNENKFIDYKNLLIGNLLSAYGMLLGFPIQGYGFVSITFSTLSVFVSYFFAVKYWKDLSSIKSHNTTHLWFKGALIFAVISSIGTFALAYMMSNRIAHQNWYLASIYYYLHFQYNGWFFFACAGLLQSILPAGIVHQHKKLSYIFWLFASSCVPAYLLSTLWMKMPSWLYGIVIIAALMQVVAWYMFIQILLQHRQLLKDKFSSHGAWVLILSAMALSIKLILQIGSTIPALGQWAFGFRSVVIAYLHLVLLGVISLFLLGFIFTEKHIKVTKLSTLGLWIFVAGVFLNEFILLLQGVASIKYILVPYSNEALLITALILLSGALMMFISKFRNE